MNFLFVGERPSVRARKLKVRWQDGALAAKPLFEALVRFGTDPHHHTWINAYRIYGDLMIKKGAMTTAHRAHQSGVTVVALGLKASKALTSHSIPHKLLVHPAARGSIRKRERYIQHVIEVLTPKPLPLP